MSNQKWPFQEERVSADRLRQQGVTPDPSWRYDRTTKTYSRPVLREPAPKESVSSGKTLVRESAVPVVSVVHEMTRAPDRTNVTLTEATNSSGKKVTRFKCVVAEVDIVNRNGKFYPKSAYQAAIDAAQEDIKAGLLWGLMEHADDWFEPLKGRLNNVAGVYDTLKIEGNQVVAGGLIADNTVGRDLIGLFDIGVGVGISTSGTCTQKFLPAKEVDPSYHDPEALIGVIQDDFRLLTIDFVSDPANPAGRASKEARQRASREVGMNKKIKALLEKFGVTTIEELKAVASAEYVAALEEIARESVATPPAPSPTPTPTPAPIRPPATGEGVNMEGYRALEETVVQLQGQVTTLRNENHNSKRDGIALTALEGAKLPSAGKIKHGETEIDLDASFRAELTEVSRNAPSDEAAREAVDQKIATRRGMQSQAQEGTPRPGSNRLSIPSGDNSRDAAQEGKQGREKVQLENTRRGFRLD